MYKQVIIIRTDLKMKPGKIAAQSAHASVAAIDKVDKKIISAWKREGQKKVVLKVAGIEELMDIKEKCGKLKIPNALITDAGLTEVKPGTVTALAIGPDSEEKIDRATGHLSLLG